VAYSPETNKLFVASAKGKLYIYDGTSFELIASIDFGGDVDNLRYDAAEKRVYVGYGDDETAAIGMVDASTNRRMPQEYTRVETFTLNGAAYRLGWWGRAFRTNFSGQLNTPGSAPSGWFAGTSIGNDRAW